MNKNLFPKLHDAELMWLGVVAQFGIDPFQICCIIVMNIRGSNLNHFWGFRAFAGECHFQRTEKLSLGCACCLAVSQIFCNNEEVLVIVQ